ncbi:hypothetical protein GCM10009554_06800 [Kribbella koreensis]|uniref:Uncharacterized protein n=1 Tax=Kribbella koreensis TaxID=57909 RepID=A0ABN1PDC0_9ACTN
MDGTTSATMKGTLHFGKQAEEMQERAFDEGASNGAVARGSPVATSKPQDTLVLSVRVHTLQYRG